MLTPPTQEELSKLREAAEAATPGPWHAPGLGELHAENHDEIAQILYAHSDEGFCGTDADANFMAAANPATVTALLDLIDAQKKLIADLEGKVGFYQECGIVAGGVAL